MVTGNSVEGITENHLASRKEDDGPNPRDDANDQRQAEQTNLRPKAFAAKFQEFWKPAERM
jgi:hypothetical protein